jgi:hypothetical protein
MYLINLSDLYLKLYSFFNLVIPYLKKQHSNNINTYSFQINNFGSIDLSKIEKNFLEG